MRIGVVLPTYNDKNQWYSVFDRFLDSLHILRSVDNLVFLVNYQNIDKVADEPYLDKLETLVIQLNNTWELITRISDPYERPISMVKIRNDCMMLDPTCDLYLFIDDDMKFNTGAAECYNFIINEFSKDDKLGLVMSAGFLGGYNHVDKLKYAVKKHWTVCRGLFIRNLHTCDESPIYPAAALTIHKGGYEEMIAAMEVVAQGYLLATHFNNPTTHKVMPMDVGKSTNKEARYTDDQIHNIELAFSTSSDYYHKQYAGQVLINKAKDYQVILEYIDKSINK